MPAPFNYSIDVADPLAQSLDAFQSGAGISQVMQQQQDAEKKRELAVQMQADLAALSQNPNPKATDFSTLMVKYPLLSEHFKRGWDVLDKSQQQDKLGRATQVYSAISAGRNDVAMDILTQQATAHRNSGDEEKAKEMEALTELIRVSPESAKTTAGLMLSGVMGPEKFAETFAKLGGERRADEEHGPKVDKAKADAHTAAVAARFAESTTVADLKKKGWDITKIQEDIKIARENARIAAMNVDIGKEANQLKRNELKLKRDEAVVKRDEDLRNKTSEVENARATTDNMLNTVDRLLVSPALKDVVGALEGGDYYPTTAAAFAAGVINPFTTTSADERADAIALAETIQSQAFLTELQRLKAGGPSGLGQLSEREGDKLEKSIQNLKRKQSEKQFTTNLKEAQRLLLKARANLARRFGVPDSVPDTPAAAAGAAAQGVSTDQILRELGVMR